MKFLIFLWATLLAVQVSSFGGGDDKFLKKYAMMKIYESCFGEDVVKQIRKEMKQACLKCANLETPTFVPTTSPVFEERPAQTQGDQSQQHGQPPFSVYPNNQPAFDAEKLHQAILAFKPNVPQPMYRPFPGVSPGSFYSGQFGNPAFSPVPPMYYPGYQQSPFAPYGFPMVGQQFYGGNRVSRDMDIKSQLEILSSKMSGRVRNVTCVMQELGYLDDNLEPNYVKISEKVGNLPVSDELRKDIQDGVEFCQQFSQCVPEVKKEKSPLSRELIRPMFFFKCYKHKKLEACIMKDVREKFSGVADEELDSDVVDLRRAGKSMKTDDGQREVEDLADSMYEFLYASDSNLDWNGLF